MTATPTTLACPACGGGLFHNGLDDTLSCGTCRSYHNRTNLEMVEALREAGFARNGTDERGAVWYRRGTATTDSSEVILDGQGYAEIDNRWDTRDPQDLLKI